MLPALMAVLVGCNSIAGLALAIEPLPPVAEPSPKIPMLTLPMIESLDPDNDVFAFNATEVEETFKSKQASFTTVLPEVILVEEGTRSDMFPPMSDDAMFSNSANNNDDAFHTVSQTDTSTGESKTKLYASASVDQIDPYFDDDKKHATVILDVPTIIAAVDENSLDVAMAINSVKRSRWEKYVVGAQLLPSVRGEFFMEKLTGSTIILNEIPLSINRVTQQPKVFLEYDFHTGFKPLFQLKAASQRQKQMQKVSERTRQQTMLTALQQYYLWKRDQQAMAAGFQNLTEAREQRELSEKKFETGFGTQLDIEQSTVVEAERESDVYQSLNQQALSKLNLRLLLNIPDDYAIQSDGESLKPAQWIDDDSANQPLSTWFIKAKKNRPEVAELDAMIKEAKAMMWASVSDVMPVIHLSSYIGSNGPEPDLYQRSFQRGVRANVDVLRFLGLNYVSTVQVQRTQVQNAILQKEKEMNRMRETLAKAYFDWKLSSQQLQTNRKKIRSASEALRIAEARKRVGVGINLEVTQAQSQFYKAQMDYLDAVTQYNTSQLQLLYETGQLSTESIQSGLASNPLSLSSK